MKLCKINLQSKFELVLTAIGLNFLHNEVGSCGEYSHSDGSI